MSSGVFWEWKDGRGWKMYDDIDIDLIETMYNTGKDIVETRSLSFNREGRYLHIFDFKTNTQSNATTGKSREIRRTVPASPVKKKSDADDAEEELAASAEAPPVDPEAVKAQTRLGAQSRRGMRYELGKAGKDDHARECFNTMLYREKRMCGEWAVFYHSYSYAAILYELQAAVASVLFRFKSDYATLPRILKKQFLTYPDADALHKGFADGKFGKLRDHHTDYRAVAISATCSCLAHDSEAPPISWFISGYSCTDLSFLGALTDLLVSWGVPEANKNSVAAEALRLAEKYELDTSQFDTSKPKTARPGHMLQIFMKRSIVNQYAYAALPYGEPDPKRPDLAKALEGEGPIEGQARLVANPSAFMRGNAVRMYVYSANKTFHDNRVKFQQELRELLNPIIGTPEVREKAARGVYAGTLPAWFKATDFEERSASPEGKKMAEAVAKSDDEDDAK